ncbi:MAG: hypothetical protein JSV20_05105 [Candidatus Bathyarchaeota archaeon]|nr:MAG: hypothetical protein JSV20_05105 [Candidatus Bathyarchaeota archaeon]
MSNDYWVLSIYQSKILRHPLEYVIMTHNKLQWGIKANLGQFILQVLLVFFVGMTVGRERNIVPILAKEEFGIVSFTVL